MKILRLTTFLNYGGIERKMENLSQTDDQNEWIFVSLNKGGEAAKNIRKSGKEVYCLNLPYSIFSLKFIYTIYKLYSFFRKEKPDVVHTAGAEANFFGIIAATLTRVKLKVSEEIGIPKHNRLARIVFKYVFSKSDYVIGESLLVTDFLRKNYNVSERKLKCISNFIPDIKKVERQIDTNCFRLVSISRLDAVKNLQSMITIMPDLVAFYPDLHYYIVGDGPEMQNLKKLVEELAMTNNVHFKGFQPNPYTYLSQSDIYILISLTEGFSNSLLEAMATATPSLSTSVGAAPEIINDKSNGWLVKAGDNSALLEKMKEIINTPFERREQIGRRGQQFVLDKYTLTRHIQDLLKIYETL